MTAELSVLFVNYNTFSDCAAAVRSLLQHPPAGADGAPMPFEVVVVDNLSPQRNEHNVALLEAALDEVRAAMHDAAAARLILHDENSGYSKGVNLAFRNSRGRWILVSNPDLLFTDGMVGGLLAALQQDPTAGCTVPKGFWDQDLMGRLPPNILPTLGDLFWTALGEFVPAVSRRYGLRHAREAYATWSDERPRPLAMMSGCLFLIERDYFERIGLMDERFPLYYEDADLSVRIARSGRTVLQVPGTHLVHYVNRSGQTDHGLVMTRYRQSRQLYYRKWYGPAGAWLERLCEWTMRTRALRWLRRGPPHHPCKALGRTARKPRIELPRRCERFVLQMSLDCRFYLSGGVLGSGSEWTPSDAMFANFAPTTYWYRAFDVSGGGFEFLGMWRYDCSKGLAEAPQEQSA